MTFVLAITSVAAPLDLTPIIAAADKNLASPTKRGRSSRGEFEGGLS